MIKIFWPTLCISIIVFFISYIKIRERIPTKKRDLFERLWMFALLILFMINILLLINERRQMSYEMTDCIRFYKYFPYFENETEFNFINKFCYKYFTEEEIQKLRKAGMNYLDPPTREHFNYASVNFSEVLIEVVD